MQTTHSRRHDVGIANALARCQWALNENATSLDLSEFRLSEIPEPVFRITSLTFLDVSHNTISNIPSAIGRLTALEVLNLQSNSLTLLPPALGRLTSLRQLDVSHNNLHRIPDEIGSCTNLRELLLAHNPLYFEYDETGKTYVPLTLHIPATISYLSRLERLCLAGNSLVDVPPGLCELASLVELDLSGNRIAQIPDALCNLQHLLLLDLRDNSLVTLPRSLLGLPSIAFLYLHGNNRLHLPMEILGPTPAEVTSTRLSPAIPTYILEYYFKTATEARPLNEAKLIFVGFGEVGKTSLINKLVYDKFNAQQPPTEEIAITDWDVRLPDDQGARLHVWDFGGQEIMHATHQFFLTSRSLYVLVLNGRQGRENIDAEYWLTIIASYAADCPVIVVLNKIGISMVSVARKSLQAKFPNITCFIETDCKEDIGITDLRQAIVREADQLPHLRDAFPAAWYLIKEKLSVMKENYLAFDRYQEMCKELGEESEPAQVKLASFLHNLGVVLHYADDPRLNYTHVLNPDWVTGGIYKVINSKTVQANKGVVSCDDLASILSDPVYPKNMHMFFIELMRKFELCFPFVEDPSFYLIPDLLEREEAADVSDFDEENCLLFEYQYPVLPEGLVPRFITRTYVLSEKHPRWRYGTVLEFEGSKAIVRGDPIKRSVRVAVKGKTAAGRRRLLAIIRSEFERIHGSYSFKPEAMVPLPGRPSAAVKYEELRTLEENGIREHIIVHEMEVIRVDVKSLLEGVDLGGEEDLAGQGRRDAQPVRVFYSYSHVDESLRDELANHLILFEREKRIASWHDRRITAGDDWAGKIDANLEQANLIMLLISSDFLASNYCYDVEMARALERGEKRLARVVPIIVRSCDWRDSVIGKLSALPTDGRAVTEWGPDKYHRDKAWTDVVKGMRNIIEAVANGSPLAS